MYTHLFICTYVCVYVHSMNLFLHLFLDVCISDLCISQGPILVAKAPILQWVINIWPKLLSIVSLRVPIIVIVHPKPVFNSKGVCVGRLD